MASCARLVVLSMIYNYALKLIISPNTKFHF
jgi:hypothetical protein